MFKFNKYQLDAIATILGAFIGISTALYTHDVGSRKVTGTIASISAYLLSVIVQKPATAEPTTEQAEESEVELE